MKRALTVGSTLGKQAELIIIIKWQIIFTQFFFFSLPFRNLCHPEWLSPVFRPLQFCESITSFRLHSYPTNEFWSVCYQNEESLCMVQCASEGFESDLWASAFLYLYFAFYVLALYVDIDSCSFCSELMIQLVRANNLMNKLSYASQIIHGVILVWMTAVILVRSYKCLGSTILAKIMWDKLAECTASTIDQFFTWKQTFLGPYSTFPPSPHAMLFIRKGLPKSRPTLHQGGRGERVNIAGIREKGSVSHTFWPRL